MAIEIEARNPILLRSYAVLRVITGGWDNKSDQMILVADSIDPQGSTFTRTHENFFVWAVLRTQGMANAVALFNLGLVEMLVFKRYNCAQGFFQQALKSSAIDSYENVSRLRMVSLCDYFICFVFTPRA